MPKVFLLLFALAIVSVRANAQNTPAPCSPANLVPTDVKQGCYNTPDCDTGFMCAFVRVMTDVVYGTTCSAELMYFCSYPNVANVGPKDKGPILLAQSTPAPCSPANLDYTYNLLGCFDSVDCSSGYECVAMRVATDTVYGTTCSETPVQYCAYPGPGGPTVPPGALNERKDHAKAILASLRTRNRS